MLASVRGIVRHGGLLRTVGGKAIVCRQNSFQRTDYKLMRTAAVSNQTLWDTLMERTIPRFDWEGAERYVWRIIRRQRTMWIDLGQWQPRHQSTIMSRRHHEINVSIVAAHSQIVPPRRITSSTHGPAALAGQVAVNKTLSEEVNQPIRCNLYAQYFGDLQTFHARVRLTPLALPSTRASSACPASSTAKTPQATLKRRTRTRAKGPPRGTAWAQRSSDTEGSSDEPPAEPSKMWRGRNSSDKSHTLFVRSAQQVVYELQVREEVEGVRQEVREVKG